MTNKVTIGGLATVALALASSASAEVKLTDNLSVAGYAAGSYQFVDDNGSSDDRLDIDAANIDFNFKKDQTSAKLGFYYQPGLSPDELTLLDANLTYDFGNGHSVTGGKYLSWLGYEPFHLPGRSFITPHFTTLSIPGYRSGVKYTYTSSEWNGGIGLSDSGFSGIKGDGELRNSYAAEAFVSYTGVKDLVIFAGLGYDSDMPDSVDTTVGELNEFKDKYIFNLWASYNINANLSAAFEYVYNKDASYSVRNSGTNAFLRTEQNEDHRFLTEAKYKIDEKLAVAARLQYWNVSASDVKGLNFAVAPSYKVTENLEVRGELGYTDFDNNSKGDATNFGIQSVFTF